MAALLTFQESTCGRRQYRRVCPAFYHALLHHIVVWIMILYPIFRDFGGMQVPQSFGCHLILEQFLVLPGPGEPFGYFFGDISYIAEKIPLCFPWPWGTIWIFFRRYKLYRRKNILMFPLALGNHLVIFSAI